MRKFPSQFTVKVFMNDGKLFKHTHRASKGGFYSNSGIEGALKEIDDRLKRLYPQSVFKLVKLKDLQFNFVQQNVLHLQKISSQAN